MSAQPGIVAGLENSGRSPMGHHPDSTNHVVERELTSRLVSLEKLLRADVLAYSGPIDPMAHEVIKAAIESFDKRRKKIVVLLETFGGYIEFAERIANTLHHHYKTVDFIVTTYAMSAGTVLVMSGDNLFMDYSATLGPIDPQIPRQGAAGFVPALGYLEQFERLVQKSREEDLTRIEQMYFLQNFDPGELYSYEQARDLSIALLEEWLVKYKFKNWRVTETRNLPVTISMKRERAAQIAERLNETKRWHSHARGITMKVANRELKLRIDDLEEIPEVWAGLMSYQNLLREYRTRLGHRTLVINWRDGYHGH
ncbi:MAG TPA: ATP-dependent Clp protease proteolytic subunit [Candidatus Paceibacterota bacterium]|nr:ATP-dependent Clp protease proteolytic subunit [Candidatus Paceibacterota bacterium]